MVHTNLKNNITDDEITRKKNKRKQHKR